MYYFSAECTNAICLQLYVLMSYVFSRMYNGILNVFSTVSGTAQSVLLFSNCTKYLWDTMILPIFLSVLRTTISWDELTDSLAETNTLLPLAEHQKDRYVGRMCCCCLRLHMHTQYFKLSSGLCTQIDVFLITYSAGVTLAPTKNSFDGKKINATPVYTIEVTQTGFSSFEVPLQLFRPVPFF